MRYLQYIVAVTALISVTACSLDNLEPTVTPGGSGDSDIVTVIGRMTRFDEKDVLTRGVKDQDEAKLTSMAMAIFKVNAAGNGLDGDCVHYQYAADQAELLFTIERGSNYDYDARYAMYVFCNMPGMADFGIGTTFEEMMAAYYDVDGIDIPENGFPMMGSLGDTFSTSFDKDNQEFILSPTVNGELTTPKVNGTTQTLLTIPMKAMFAKVNFTIEVRPDQTIDGNYSPQFTLDGYTVNNVPAVIDFKNNTNDDDNVLAESFSLPVTGNTVASGANTIKFSFYLPERYLEPATKPEAYDYPFKNNGKIRGEDSLYMQRYKPELAGDKPATNVKIEGRFRDHQNHYWDVDYTIFLGEDNFGDFNIVRNSEYNNFVTIRGIQTSNDMSDEEEAISIDHRVNVERTQPAIISLRRETLLDSHFEVRPLRVRASDIGNIEGINAVKVEVVNPTTTNWMRLERSFGDGTADGSPQTTVDGKSTSIYIDSDPDDAAYGKRKFFTYDLVTGGGTNLGDLRPLNNSTEVILPLSNATECCWIYVDECTEVGDAVRSGIVKVSYGSYDGTTFTPANNASYPDVNYIINQRKLFQVTYDSDNDKILEDNEPTYCLEYEEEYLHNFDADDNYGETQFDGMSWGLYDQQLSSVNDALFFDSGWGDWINDIINSIKDYVGVDPVYDFYVSKHDTSVSNSAIKYTRAGYDFSIKIIQAVNGGTSDKKGVLLNSDDKDNIDVLPLNQQPESAVEYCYNKNKRNRNGQVAWTDNTDNLNWYLPATDEIEETLTSAYLDQNGKLNYTYSRFIEFQQQYYWSSQPAFIQNYAWYGIVLEAEGPYYNDYLTHARATRVVFDNGYNPDPSGVKGYHTGIRVYFNWGLRTTTYGAGQTYDGITFGTIIEEPGAQPRAEKNRIRCVRKMD